MRRQATTLIPLDIGTATIFHRTTSTYAVGSSKERRSQLELSLALPQASPRENRITAFPRPRTPSRFLSTGSPSQAQGTVELRSILPPGPLRRNPAFTLLSTSTIWRKRFASYRQFPRPPPSISASNAAGTRRLNLLLFQGEINVDQAHRGYDVTEDETGKTWYNPF